MGSNSRLYIYNAITLQNCAYPKHLQLQAEAFRWESPLFWSRSRQPPECHRWPQNDFMGQVDSGGCIGSHNVPIFQHTPKFLTDSTVLLNQYLHFWQEIIQKQQYHRSAGNLHCFGHAPGNPQNVIGGPGMIPGVRLISGVVHVQ